jgi:hypothetical protein
MRAKFIFVGVFIGGLGITMANGQASGGASDGASAAAATAPPAAGGTVQVQGQGTVRSQTTVPQAVQPRQQLAPALQNRLQSRQATGTTNNSGANGQFPSTNAFASTNGFRTNTPGWSPTGRSGASNSVFWNSNNGSFVSTNRTSAMFQDRAVNTADQALLVSVRQTVVARLQPLGAWSPAVHFQVNSGIVTLVGVVTTIQISQQIEATVVQVPGVIRVVNDLRVASNAGFGGGTVVPMTRTNNTAVPR